MATVQEILDAAMSDPSLTGEEQKYLQQIAAGGASPQADIPSFLPQGFVPESATVDGVRFVAPSALKAGQAQDEAQRTKSFLDIGNTLASQFQFPEVVPEKVVINEKIVPAVAGGPVLENEKTQRTILGGMKNRPATLADIGRAQIVPNPAIPDGPDLFGALSFGAGPAIPLNRDAAINLALAQNAGRSLRGEFAPSSEVIREGITSPVPVPDFIGDPMFRTQPNAPVAIPDQGEFVPMNRNAPAAQRNSPLFPVTGPVAAAKPLTSDIVFTARQNVGGDRDKIRAWLVERGYAVE